MCLLELLCLNNLTISFNIFSTGYPSFSSSDRYYDGDTTAALVSPLALGITKEDLKQVWVCGKLLCFHIFVMFVKQFVWRLHIALMLCRRAVYLYTYCKPKTYRATQSPVFSQSEQDWSELKKQGWESGFMMFLDWVKTEGSRTSGVTGLFWVPAGFHYKKINVYIRGTGVFELNDAFILVCHLVNAACSFMVTGPSDHAAKGSLRTPLSLRWLWIEVSKICHCG